MKSLFNLGAKLPLVMWRRAFSQSHYYLNHSSDARIAVYATICHIAFNYAHIKS